MEKINFEPSLDERIILSSSTPMNFYTTGHWLSYPTTLDWENILINIKDLPKEYYINEKKKTVVLKWNDDTITKVKTTEADKFDARLGFLIAYFQKHCGLSKTKANKYLDQIVEIEEKK